VPTPVRRQTTDSRYSLRFAGAAALLVAGTLVLVLYVLPQRYVLSSGFREGSLILPDPSTPFASVDPVRVAPLPAPPPPEEPVPGPAEIFWARVLPLLEAERYEEAIPFFSAYLSEYPDDRDVQREFALTLAAAGYLDRSLPLFEGLLAESDDPALRLVLARALRDAGRVDEASEHYARILAGDPDHEELALEWARALAWAEQYGEAERVLLAALDRNPGSSSLRVALAEVYYYTDRLEEADALLATLSDEDLDRLDALGLRDGVRLALTPPPAPEPEPVPPLSTLEQALAAREAGELDRAAELFAAALAEAPADAATWEAFANFLQYERADFEGALSALKEVERLTGGGDTALQYRMAQLEIWTDRADDARARLETLLVTLDHERRAERDPAADSVPPDAATPAPAVTRPDVLALLGDLDRWSGRRLAAVDRYEAALVLDSEHTGARDGLAAIRTEVDRMYVDVEQPHLGALGRSLADTDDFVRVDLGADWRGIQDDWVWGAAAGGRWIEGYDLSGAFANQPGLFADLEGAHWWRWGTIRTALHLGVQTVREGEVDVGLGASARFMGSSGARTDVRVDHQPAYDVTNTLQAVLADVQQDKLYVSHSRLLGSRWVAAATAEAASVDHGTVAGADRNTRLQGGVSVGRILSPHLTLGLTGRALTYSDAAPTSGGLPLYWDPEVSVSTGLYAQYARPLFTWWELSARMNPGVAWIDERTGGGEFVPDLSGSLGLVREGARYRTAIEFSYGQGRFTGYRSWGVNVSFGARGWFGRAGGGS
jgi:tetratricopeptide (TPR) repeat protein